MSSFPGFPRDLFAFLVELKASNNRDWFEANKQRYEDSVRTPALEFIESLQKPLQKVSRHFAPVSKKVGGSLMRIHRDVRFSKDKSPYKTNVGIHIRHASGRDVHAPGFYIHIDPEELFFGAGIWHPAPEALRQIREVISTRPQEWRKARDAKAFRDRYSLTGDSARRPPQGFDQDHPEIEDLKRKDFIGIQQVKPALFLSGQLVDESVKAFRSAMPLMKFLCGALNLPC